MTNNIPPLQPGDLVALAAPARKVSPDEMAPAINTLRSWNLKIKVPDGLYLDDGQLAGSDTHRAALFQQQLDDPNVKAILCCRGGYGSVRIIDRLDFSRFALNPKWIVGYSDITVLHSHLHASLNIPSLHATMPINFPTHGENNDTRSLHHALFSSRTQPLLWQPNPLNRPGQTTATLVGGNLSILYSLLGSPSQIDTRGKILLIEDIDEYRYHIDRMMQALRRAGMLHGLAALLVGHLTDIHDNTTPFGRSPQQAILDAMHGTHCPIAFDTPVGHLPGSNHALILGQKISLSVSNSENSRIFAP